MKTTMLLILASIALIAFAALYNGKPSPTGPHVKQPGTPAAPSHSGHSTSAFPANAISSKPTSTAATAISSVVASVKQALSSAAPGSVSGTRTYRRADLRIVRGMIVEQVGNGLVLNCGGWIVQSVHGYVYAGDGEGMDPLHANLVDMHELQRFGRLMTMDKGQARQSISVYPRSLWNVGSYLDGTVLLEDYSGPWPGVGKGLKVVGAPFETGQWRGKAIAAYTARFNLSD